jgi:succinyl-diaminopimelate desuccinylase
VIDVDIRYLPGQDPDEIKAQVADLEGVTIIAQFHRMPVIVERNNPFVTVLSECASKLLDTETISVGRDGASDAICFLEAGVPAVEFGPLGAGHHGPAEWVSLTSYRQTLVEFARLLPKRLPGEPHLRIA